MTTRICPKCQGDFPLTAYQSKNGRPSGWCRICKTTSEKDRRARNGIPVRRVSFLTNTGKCCAHCGQTKDRAEFSPSRRGLGGLQAYCKTCFTAYYRVTKSSARKATTKYRTRHRERHLTAHRVRMFEYNSRKKVTSDGSVTDRFLIQLYSTRHCAYCSKITPMEQRTADHKMPLSLGGTHTADNLVMACFSCNSAKRDMTYAEFLEKINDDDKRHNHPAV